MERQKRAEALQQLLVIAGVFNPHIFFRDDSSLYIQMGDVVPYALLTSTLNSLGKDPLSSLRVIQDLLDSCRKFLGVDSIVFSLNGGKGEYREIEITDAENQNWLLLGANPSNLLPKFKGVSWCVVAV